MAVTVAVVSKNKLNEAELASVQLKVGAVKLYNFLTEPLPDLASIKKHRDRIPFINEWQERAVIANKPYLRANGGKHHDEFRELWRAAWTHCEQVAVNTAAKWLDEQFNITEWEAEREVASESTSESTDESSEHPATDHVEIGSDSGDSLAAVGDVQAGQKPTDRRNRRRDR